MKKFKYKRSGTLTLTELKTQYRKYVKANKAPPEHLYLDSDSYDDFMFITGEKYPSKYRGIPIVDTFEDPEPEEVVK